MFLVAKNKTFKNYDQFRLIMGNNGAILLTGHLGREVYKKYSRLVDDRFQRKGQLVLQFPNGGWRYDLMIDNNGTIQGCGSFSMCLMDEVLQRYGLRIVDLYGYQSLAKLDNSVSEALKGMHLNLGLILIGDKKFDFRKEDQYHNGTKKLKQDLQNQLTERRYSLTEPVYIPFSSLELEVDDRSSFGLRFKLLETTLLQSSKSLRGDDSSKVLDTAVVYVKKARKQGLYDFKFYANVICIKPKSIEDILKPHHSMGLESFDKMSHSYGRLLVIPKDYGQDSIKALLSIPD